MAGFLPLDISKFGSCFLLVMVKMLLCHVTYNTLIWNLPLFNQDFLLVFYKTQSGIPPFVTCLIKLYLFCQPVITQVMAEVVQPKIK